MSIKSKENIGLFLLAFGGLLALVKWPNIFTAVIYIFTIAIYVTMLRVTEDFS